jgi:hypothetical protein
VHARTYLFHGDIFIEDVGDGAIVATANNFHVNPLHSFVHVNIAKCDVVDIVMRTYATNAKPQATCFNVLKEHIRSGLFDSNAIILVIDPAVVNPYIITRYIKTICVKSAQIVRAVRARVIWPCAIGITVSDLCLHEYC